VVLRMKEKVFDPKAILLEFVELLSNEEEE
jgi:hypothetical protein